MAKELNCRWCGYHNVDRNRECLSVVDCRVRLTDRIAALEEQVKIRDATIDTMVEKHATARIEALREAKDEGWLQHALGCSGGYGPQHQCKCRVEEVFAEIAQHEEPSKPREESGG